MSNLQQQNSSARPLLVLVVDDTASNRQILEVFLTKLGYKVLTAENGAVAVERFVNDHPDLVLMDVMMPVMDGYEATRRIKALAGDRWVPVVFLSALSKDENLVTGMDVGGDDYLSKPINFVVLDAKLRSFSRTLQMQRSLDASRKQMAAISENIIDGVITITAEGTITWASHSAQFIFGYDAEELVGQNVQILMPEPYRSHHDSYLSNYLNGGTPKIIGVGQREFRGRRKGGESFPMELGVNEMVVDGERSFVGIVRDISERKVIESRLRSNAERLQRYYDEQERENQLAKDILQRVVQHPGLDDPALDHWVAPATNFSGDIVAGARNDAGQLFLMLADATGHGLAAAISALPVLTSFYGMVKGGRDMHHMLERLNQSLRSMLPSGRFVAATVLCVDEANRRAEIWQGGMPPLLWLNGNGQVKESFDSDHLPLGIVDFDDDMARIREVTWEEGDQFLLFSDGVIEAANSAGEEYGLDGLKHALAGKGDGSCIEAVRNNLRHHTAGIEQMDDISMLVATCRGNR